jgi:hypothetical protein
MTDDDLRMLRRVGDEPRPMSADARERARRRMLAPATPSGRPPRRPAAVLAALAAAACAAFTALTLSDDLPAPVPGLPAAQANPTLLRAAAAARSQPARARPRDDQYLYERALLVETRTDGAGRPQRFVDEAWRSVDASRPTRTSERGRSWISAPSDGMWPPARYEDLASLPTDPDGLRRAVVDRFGGPGTSAAVDRETEVMGLLMLLRGWRVMPPALRGAIFAALAELPEVRVREDVADARGRRGVGVGAADARVFGHEVIVDRRTFEYLGMRATMTRSDGVEVDQRIAILEAGVVDELDQRP